MGTDRPLANTYWVLPGSLLAGEYPHGSSTERMRERLRGLLDAGVNTFIDLTERDELPEYQSLLPGGVEYLRSPIPDAGTPESAEQMHAIQARLQAALDAGRCVYVHCRAGIGRTGTVIGCYLAQQSLDGEQALAHLNRLWRQSGRSAGWPRVPQTDDQANFIRAWPTQLASELEAPALEPLRALRRRFLGSLTGLALCDALGAATQYRRAGSFAPIGDLIGGGPFDLARGAWSDDTAMTLCLAESLIERDGFDAADQLRRYAQWQQTGHLSATQQCVGITAATAWVLGRAGQAQPVQGQPVERVLHESAPLSRVAATALFYLADPAQGLAQTEAAVGVFGAAPVVRDASRFLAAMLQAALRGEPLAQVLRPSLAQFSRQPLLPALVALHATDPSKPPPVLIEPALTALASARWALAAGDSFRAGALRAANLGGDSDVVGAVYGQLAGAVYGQDGIPPGWLSSLVQRPLIEGFADRLLTSAVVAMAPTPG